MTLTVRELSFGYRRTLFDGLNLELAPGDIRGLHGYSGAGKTTLAKLLAGHLTPHRGQVRIDGRPLPRRGYRPVQLVGQHPERAVDPRARVSTLVTRTPPAVLDSLRINRTWLTRRPTELSGGQLQRLVLARALDARTRYLVADEITTMLDGITQAEIWRALVALALERELGMLVISHDLALLNHIADDVIAL